MGSLGLGLGLGMSKLLSALDSDVKSFADESGATDLAGLNSLVKYIKDQGLYGNFVIYPMKSDQNAGSGSTVYSLGGLTSNNATLSNGPTWGAANGPLSFDGVNQYASINDFLGTDTLGVFARINHTVDGTAAVNPISQFNFGAANQRSWRLSERGNDAANPWEITRSSDGTSSSLTTEAYQATQSGSGSDSLFYSEWIAGGGRALYINNVSQSLTLDFGSSQTTRFDSTSTVNFSCALNNGVPAGFSQDDFYAAAFVYGATLTTEQRTQISNLINAL